MNYKQFVIGGIATLIVLVILLQGKAFNTLRLTGAVTFPFSGTVENASRTGTLEVSASIHDVCPEISDLESLCNGAKLYAPLFDNQGYMFSDGIICWGGYACGPAQEKYNKTYGIVNNANYLTLSCESVESGFDEECQIRNGSVSGTDSAEGPGQGAGKTCTFDVGACASAPYTGGEIDGADAGADSGMNPDGSTDSGTNPDNPVTNPDGPVTYPDPGTDPGTNPDTGTTSGETSGDPGTTSGETSGTTAGSTSGETSGDPGTTSGETSGDPGTTSGDSSGDNPDNPPPGDCPAGTHQQWDIQQCPDDVCAACETARDACLQPCMDYCANYPGNLNDANTGEDTCDLHCRGSGNSCMLGCNYDFQCEVNCSFDGASGNNDAGAPVCNDNFHECCFAAQDAAGCPSFVSVCVPDTDTGGSSSQPNASSAPNTSSSPDHPSAPDCETNSDCPAKVFDNGQSCIPSCSGGECFQSCPVGDPFGNPDCSSFTPSLCARCIGGMCDTCCGGSNPTDDSCAGVDCNDNNACTSDFCSKGSCIHASKTCNDGDSCTTDSCDPSSGACSNTPKDCDDGNACTKDSCSNGACVNTTKVCSTPNACTTGSCNPNTGECMYIQKDCFDDNACTTDSCNPSTGSCTFTKITSDQCSVCENEPECPKKEGCVYLTDPTDENGCRTACGAENCDPYGKCPIPVCADPGSIPEGCTMEPVEGNPVDDDGCPLYPCGKLSCPDGNQPDCNNNSQCENIETYHLDKDPNCREIPGAENVCGCASYECYITAPVQCCVTPQMCYTYATSTNYRDDPEQYKKEVDWLIHAASNISDLDSITNLADRIAFCENLGNPDEPPPGSGPTGCATITCPQLDDGCIYVNIPADSNNCPTGCGTEFCPGGGGSASSKASTTSKNSVASTTSIAHSVSRSSDTSSLSFASTISVKQSSVPSSTHSYSFGLPFSTSSFSFASQESTSRYSAGTSTGNSPAICGDHQINQAFEQCDDGNINDGDGCSSTCQNELSGGTSGGTYGGTNGGTSGGTTGGGIGGSPRDPSPPVCGDGRLQYGEQCDDGNKSDGDGCGGSCLLESGTGPFCGDTILTVGEECDYGSANSYSPNFCRPDCTAPRCGDGIIDDRMEECDDGNTQSGDGCSEVCTSEGNLIASSSVCGDGILSYPEECDDGNQRNGDGCSVNCLTEESVVASASICGDGVLNPTEECDDSNRRDNDGCSSTCKLEIGVCGDGVVQSLLGEQCEQATFDSSLPYSCVRCRFSSPTCGNGTVDPGEECDEGAKNSNNPNANCRQDCSLSRCGDGILDDVELCDDGNHSNGDGCDRYCKTESSTMVAGENTQNAQYFTVPSAIQNLQQLTFPQLPTTQSLPAQLPLAQLQPLVQGQAPIGDTGPAAVAVVGAGAAAGMSWIRRRKK